MLAREAGEGAAAPGREPVACAGSLSPVDLE